jgi:hypothetical protein
LKGILSNRIFIALAVLILLLTVSVSLYVTSQTIKATKLLIVSPSGFIDLDKNTEITIKAIDNSGTIDKNRNDLVELTLRSVSRNESMAKLSSTSVKLDKGIGLAYIRGRIAEVVDLTLPCLKTGDSSFWSVHWLVGHCPFRLPLHSIPF